MNTYGEKSLTNLDLQLHEIIKPFLLYSCVQLSFQI